MSTFVNPAVRPAPSTRDDVEIITPDQYSDRRAEPRVACDDRGVLILLPAGEVLSCRVIDQSASGARISFEKVDGVASDAWLIDIGKATVRHGSAAWATMNRMGLKFDLIQQLAPDAPRPPKVPQLVYEAWLMLSGHRAAPPPPPEDDVLYFD